jgi:hypothetical protein
MSQQAALDERRRAFIGFGIVGLILVGVGQAISGAVGGETEPDLITAIAWGVLALDVPTLGPFFFTPTTAARLGGDPVTVAKNLARLGAALAFIPIPVGFALLAISGDPWRMYVFVILSVGAGIYFWNRVGAVIASLSTPETGG